MRRPKFRHWMYLPIVLSHLLKGVDAWRGRASMVSGCQKLKLTKADSNQTAVLPHQDFIRESLLYYVLDFYNFGSCGRGRHSPWCHEDARVSSV